MASHPGVFSMLPPRALDFQGGGLPPPVLGVQCQPPAHVVQGPYRQPAGTNTQAFSATSAALPGSSW